MAQEAKSFEHFKSIPVLHEGRIKPLDTYARNLLVQFSGRDHYEHTQAPEWFAKLLFTPEAAYNDKVILINDPEIATALNIRPEEHRRYSFAQLKDALPKLEEMKEAANNIDEHQRSLAENEIIRAAQNVELYRDFTHEFLWAIELAKGAEELKTVVSHLINGNQAYKNLPFAVIPVAAQNDWASPWDAIVLDFGNDQTKKLFGLWYKMYKAYTEGNFIEFDISAQLYQQAVMDSLSPQETKTVHKFPLELAYQAAMPFLWARIFYILAFIFFIVSFASPKKLWYWLGLAAVIAGFVPHTLGMIARIIIMARPPVTSLYETFIFVGFIAVLLGLGIEHFNRRWLGIMTAAISGTILLFIAGRYSAEGDTLKMLVAVLNSNFWLGTHVTTITMGYGATCVAGILGHIWLIQAALKAKEDVRDNTFKTTLGIMGVALALTFLGTNLGGIWADQSWGRFWGWDPKENGALMIVLWLAILFHAKFSRMIGPIGLAVGCVIGMMVVMWAWFGVNLLSIGLHSYGFTSGIANALVIYAICEILFIILTCFIIRLKAS